jgi:hypothetical protein
MMLESHCPFWVTNNCPKSNLVLSRNRKVSAKIQLEFPLFRFQEAEALSVPLYSLLKRARTMG